MSFLVGGAVLSTLQCETVREMWTLCRSVEEIHRQTKVPHLAIRQLITAFKNEARAREREEWAMAQADRAMAGVAYHDWDATGQPVPRTGGNGLDPSEVLPNHKGPTGITERWAMKQFEWGTVGGVAVGVEP